MILLPAIDILDGKAVRLARGAFDERTVYDADPLEAAKRWVAQGARTLHIVDLDGARTGEPANIRHVERIAKHVDVPLQVGGGLRNAQAVMSVIDAGASRVVLGTAAYTDVDFLDTVIAAHQHRIVVSVDARNGHVAAKGWTEQTEIPADSVVEHLGCRGVRRFVYSSIERDGMLSGPDLAGAQKIAQSVRGSFVYSGGIASLADLEQLVALRQVNLAGVIVGKALYEEKFTVADGQSVLDRRV
jgi:phosphoribosylformimino-5-aminoimidazole carboxamide ribotide isomerase